MTRSPATGPATGSPGRPRSSRADAAITQAALDILAEDGTVAAMSIEAVAARAGVGKATIYRRWPGKEALLRDAIRSLTDRPPEPVGGSIRDDLVALLGWGRETDGRIARIMSCLASEAKRHPGLHRLCRELIEPRRELVREVLQCGVRIGELRADLDVEAAVSVLVAPVLIQRMVRWHPHPVPDDADLPGRVIDTVLAGLSRR